MQSAVDHVLKVLDRTHDPLRVPGGRRLGARRRASSRSASTSSTARRGSRWPTGRPVVEAALACRPDHVSAYSLIVEDGTALARRVRRGELPMPDEDDLADKYLLADERLERRWPGVVRGLQLGHGRRRAAAGTTCSTGPAATGGASDPAPTPTSAACAGGTSSTRRPTPTGSPPALSPAHAREVLDDESRRVERVLLELRLREGLPVSVLDATGRAAVARPDRRRAADAGTPSGWCRPSAAGCSPTRVVRDLLP